MEGEDSFVLPVDWDIPEAERALMSESTKLQIKKNFALEEEYRLRFRRGGGGNPNNFKSPVESPSVATVQGRPSAGASECKKSHGRSDDDGNKEAKRQRRGVELEWNRDTAGRQPPSSVILKLRIIRMPVFCCAVTFICPAV